MSVSKRCLNFFHYFGMKCFCKLSPKIPPMQSLPTVCQRLTSCLAVMQMYESMIQSSGLTPLLGFAPRLGVGPEVEEAGTCGC